jgi:hypothetical protein
MCIGRGNSERCRNVSRGNRRPATECSSGHARDAYASPCDRPRARWCSRVGNRARSLPSPTRGAWLYKAKEWNLFGNHFGYARVQTSERALAARRRKTAARVRKGPVRHDRFGAAKYRWVVHSIWLPKYVEACINVARSLRDSAHRGCAHEYSFEHRIWRVLAYYSAEEISVFARATDAVLALDGEPELHWLPGNWSELSGRALRSIASRRIRWVQDDR